MAYALYAIIYKIWCSAKRPLTLFVYLFIAFSIFYLLARISVICKLLQANMMVACIKRLAKDYVISASI